MNEQQKGTASNWSVGRHPIRVVAERTGLSLDVLRVWERRYGVVEPTRDESGHRLYSDADIEHLRLVGRAIAAGRKIGHLAGLSTEALVELVRGDEAARWVDRHAAAEVSDPVGGWVGEAAPPEAERRVVQLIEATRVLNGMELGLLLRRSAAEFGAHVFLQSVVAPFLRRVGEEWHAGRLSVAQEHLASAVTRSVLGELRAPLVFGSGAERIVVGTLPGERHEIGALLVSATAELVGWRTTYLGADVPLGELVQSVLATSSMVAAVSVVHVPDKNMLDLQLRELRDRLPAKVELVIGGAGAAHRAGLATRPGVTVLASLTELRTLLTSLSAAHQTVDSMGR